MWEVAHYNKTIEIKLHIFHLDRSPITIRLFWKTLYVSTRQLPHYNETIFKNLCIFPEQFTPYYETIWKNLCIIHLDRSPITMTQFWKIVIFFS
jgi:hypothetical protein